MVRFLVIVGVGLLVIGGSLVFYPASGTYVAHNPLSSPTTTPTGRGATTLNPATTTLRATSTAVSLATTTNATTTPRVSEEQKPLPESAFPWKQAIATVFWVGESATSDNDYIHNSASAWDEEWEQHFGGLDDPECREGFAPCKFTPNENPFYVALPYNDFDEEGKRRASAARIPWFSGSVAGSFNKNRWVEVRAGSTSCFGQWEDVGPYHEDDFEYVFGAATKPLNTFGEKAGIDLSPAVRDCLDVGGISHVEWRHVDDEQVPDGPWKTIITHSR